MKPLLSKGSGSDGQFEIVAFESNGSDGLFETVAFESSGYSPAPAAFESNGNGSPTKPLLSKATGVRVALATGNESRICSRKQRDSVHRCDCDRVGEGATVVRGLGHWPPTPCVLLCQGGGGPR